MSDAAQVEARPLRLWMYWTFITLMAALTVLFIFLGKWQLDRLAWKEGLIAQVDARMHLAAVPLPPAAEWVGFDADTYQYRQVSVTGHYLNDQAVRVFVGLDEAKGRFSGPGYWIMTPFAIDGGGTVFVDRGFVPEQLAGAFANDQTAPTGPITITGVAMGDEEPGPFTPGADASKRIEWVRSVPRLARMLPPGLGAVAPVYIDLPAGPPGMLPQGGETSIAFPNNHLGYAWTWFGFAIVTPLMLGVWIWRQRKRGAARGG